MATSAGESHGKAAVMADRVKPTILFHLISFVLNSREVREILTLIKGGFVSVSVFDTMSAVPYCANTGIFFVIIVFNMC